MKWDSVTEEMKRLRIGGAADITCQFGDKLNLSNHSGKTLFTTSEKVPNQDDFTLQYLRNQ